jgi:hypothetical protein
MAITKPTAGQTILASFIATVIDAIENLTTGHTHNGTDSRALAAGSVGATMLGTAASFNSAVTRYLVLGPHVFMDNPANSDWANVSYSTSAISSTGTGGVAVTAQVSLPHGAIVTSFKVYWYRDDALSSGHAILYKVTFAGAATEMATAHPTGTSGAETVEDTSIASATIDLTTSHYQVTIDFVPNNSLTDIRFYCAVITYTITQPLP